jgi:subtilisin
MRAHTYAHSILFILAIVLAIGLSGSLSVGAAPPAPVGSYVIVFNDSVDVATAVRNVARAYDLQTGFVYQHALKGMSAVVPVGRLAALERDPRVAYVVEDMERSISVQTIPTGIQRIFADTNANIDIDGSDDFRVDVDVAVIDTGVDFEHPDLVVVGGVNCSGGSPFTLQLQRGRR